MRAAAAVTNFTADLHTLQRQQAHVLHRCEPNEHTLPPQQQQLQQVRLYSLVSAACVRVRARVYACVHACVHAQNHTGNISTQAHNARSNNTMCVRSG